MPASKFSSIASTLRGELSSGTLSTGDRYFSENQLAVRFGVSRPTAGRALAALTEEGLLERRVGSGTFIRRTTNRSAEAPPRRTFGLILAGLGSTETWDPLTTQIARACSTAGMFVAIGPDPTPQDDVAAAQALVDQYLAQGVDGVFFSPMENVEHRQQENIAIVERLRDAHVPIVLIDRDVFEFPERSDLDLVSIDSFQAGVQIGRHLARAQRTRPCFLSRPGHPATTDLRVAGCRTALQAAGLAVDQDWHVSGEPSDVDIVRAVIAERSPDVIVCSNDLTAALLIQSLTRLRLRVPDDLAVVGFDDVVYSTLLSVSLTTMHQPFAAIARTALRAMVERVANPRIDPRQLLLTARLVVRDSSPEPRTVA